MSYLILREVNGMKALYLKRDLKCWLLKTTNSQWVIELPDDKEFKSKKYDCLSSAAEGFIDEICPNKTINIIGE